MNGGIGYSWFRITLIDVTRHNKTLTASLNENIEIGAVLKTERKLTGVSQEYDLTAKFKDHNLIGSMKEHQLTGTIRSEEVE